jgi:uncharacterized protein
LIGEDLALRWNLRSRHVQFCACRYTGWLALLVLVGLACDAQAQPASDVLLRQLKPKGVVSDFPKVLSDADRQAIEQRLNDLEQKTGAQVRVAILDSLQGGEINDFAEKLFQRWGVGQKDKNNGVLLLVAIKDRKARIEVGYGLEPILPDALAGRILDEDLFPAFRQQQYAKGIRAGVNRIAEIIERGERASEADRHPRDKRLSVFAQVGTTLFLSLFVAAGFFLAGLGIGSRTVLLIVFGLFFGGLPMVVGFSIGGVPAGTILPAVGLLTLWAGYKAGRASPKKFRGQTNSRGRGRKGAAADNAWVWGASGGGGGGGGSSGGGFSGGGFSGGGFGGGSSGGGGASGSW